jgi:hypothetical protein
MSKFINEAPPYMLPIRLDALCSIRSIGNLQVQFFVCALFLAKSWFGGCLVPGCG